MGRRLIVVIFFMLSGLTSCGGGGGGELSQETIDRACTVVGLPTKIIGGVACGGLDTSPIVRVAALVRVAGQEVPVPICTGTLISSDDVLTATHCIDLSDLGGRTVVGYGVIVGEAGGAVLYRASQALAAPGLDVVDGRLINDLAVLSLEAAPALAVMPVLLSREARKGETGFVYGYGLQEVAGESKTNNFISLQGGAMRINVVGSEFIQARFNGTGTNVCNGDSGGPMIIQDKTGTAIVGIVSQGSVEGCRSGDVTSFTNVAKPALVEWLTSVVPDLSVR
jgi:secreted trypsin-like serine protease